MSETEELPTSVAKVKQDIETRIEAETIGIELLEKLKDVVDSRKKLREAEEDLTSTIASVKTAITVLTDKLDSLVTFKYENLQIEREVLTSIQQELKRLTNP